VTAEAALEVGEHVAGGHPEIDQFGRETVEELLQRLLAPGEEPVNVP
jgi:hypothetical protein